MSGTPRVFQINGRGPIPSDAVAITGNLTVANQSAGGYVSLGPTASAAPTSSTLNFPKGDTRANAVTVAVDGTGQLAATFKSAAGATTNLILDVTGYFVRDTAGSTYNALDPSRVLDTRTGTGLSGKFSDSTPRSFAVAGQGGVPAGRRRRHRQPDRRQPVQGRLRLPRADGLVQPVLLHPQLPVGRHPGQRA